MIVRAGLAPHEVQLSPQVSVNLAVPGGTRGLASSRGRFPYGVALGS